jgi:hypothetical protein
MDRPIKLRKTLLDQTYRYLAGIYDYSGNA